MLYPTALALGVHEPVQMSYPDLTGYTVRSSNQSRSNSKPKPGASLGTT